MGKRQLYGEYGSGIVTHVGGNGKRVVHRPIPRSDDPDKLALERKKQFEKNNKEFEDYKTVIKAAQNIYLQGYVDTKDIIEKLVLDKIIPLDWFERDAAGKVRIKERRKYQIEGNKIPGEYKIGVRKIKAFIRYSIGERKSNQEILDRLNTEEFLLPVHHKNGKYEKSRETFLNNIFSQTMLEIKMEIAARRAKIFDQDDPR